MASDFTFHQLRSFIAVAEESNFRRAALRLRVSQSPLTRQVQALESTLGVRLFNRAGRGVELSPAGAAFLREAQSLVEATDRARQVAADAAAGRTGSLSVGYTEPVAFDMLPHVLLRFRQEYPDVELQLSEMHSYQSVDQLEQRAIDVAYLRPPIESQSVELTMLHADPLIAALPASHPLAERATMDLAALSDEPFLTYTSAMGGGISGSTAQACAAAGFAPDVVDYASSTPMLMSLVASGAGVALVSHQFSLIPYLGVRFVQLTDTRAESFLALATRGNDTSPAAEALCRISIDVSNEVFGRVASTTSDR